MICDFKGQQSYCTERLSLCQFYFFAFLVRLPALFTAQWTALNKSDFIKGWKIYVLLSLLFPCKVLLQLYLFNLTMFRKCGTEMPTWTKQIVICFPVPAQVSVHLLSSQKTQLLPELYPSQSRTAHLHPLIQVLFTILHQWVVRVLKSIWVDKIKKKPSSNKTTLLTQCFSFDRNHQITAFSFTSVLPGIKLNVAGKILHFEKKSY